MGSGLCGVGARRIRSALEGAAGRWFWWETDHVRVGAGLLIIDTSAVVHRSDPVQAEVVGKECRAAVKAPVLEVVPPDRGGMLEWSYSIYRVVSSVELSAELHVAGLKREFSGY